MKHIRMMDRALALLLPLITMVPACRIDPAPRGTPLTDAPVKKLDMVVVGFDNSLLAVAWRPDGHEVFAGGTSTSAAFVNAADGVVLNRFSFTHGPLRSASYSRDGALLAVGGSDYAGVWAIDHDHQSTAIFEITGDSSTPFAVAWSPAADELAVAGSVTQAVTLWTSGGVFLRAFTGVPGACLSPAWSRHGTLVAAVCAGGTIGVWQAATGALLAAHTGLTGGQLFSVSWNAGGTELAAAGSDKNVYVLNAGTGMALQTLTGQPTPISAVAWHPSKNWILSAGWDRGQNVNNHLMLWDAAAGKMILKVVDHTTGNTALAWSLDGESFATVNVDGVLKIRNTSALQE